MLAQKGTALNTLVALSRTLLLFALLALPTPAAGVHSTFTTGMDGWDVGQWGGAASWSVAGGRLCVTVTGTGANPWEVSVYRRGIALDQGHTYTISFQVSASRDATIQAHLQHNGEPYTQYWQKTGLVVSATPQVITEGFTNDDAADKDVDLTFQVGAGGGNSIAPGTVVCLDDISLDDRQHGPAPAPTAYPVGAGRESPSLEPLDFVGPLRWQIGGFRAVPLQPAGSAPRVVAGRGGQGSEDMYDRLKRDALHYFYYSRSSTAIEMPYAVDPKWARPAGPPDSSVSCQPGDPKCPGAYSLDVAKGWYDAGDYGKYVVNGGIAVWTLMNAYERAQHFGDPASFGDDWNIPESGNGVPDILDEARWEMEFLLHMQVPAGQPLGGMVHHKMHDNAWGPIPQAPAENRATRYLHAPSTAATLNLAATAAQCARLFRPYDAAFAGQCLGAAERAWQAALNHPAIYADPGDTNGGGAYGDTKVDDEFYWAGAELYATTGKSAYLDFIRKSPYFLAIGTTAGSERPAGDVGLETSMTWGDTAALGTITLAVAPAKLPPDDVAAARAGIQAAAGTYLEIQSADAYGAPMRAGAIGGYPWGSNSFLLNNAIVMALAKDFSGEARYAAGVRQTMDYILGRNPLDHSYVTGYGTNPTQHPHHRFWANEGTYPPPPPGVLSGGPDSNLQDPVAMLRLAGCAPQKCYVDDRGSYSTNEVAINWNAPLVWVAAFLDEQQ